ncbi:MAG: hypothetical protein BWZ10_00351 [candidate division BRC1 bacterium ADurb.BinA364]|nr:MAG: hypothetical protein BWZ10_00351 [candidate division BRC1 bacterium ADurb.BinA364]
MPLRVRTTLASIALLPSGRSYSTWKESRSAPLQARSKSSSKLPAIETRGDEFRIILSSSGGLKMSHWRFIGFGLSLPWRVPRDIRQRFVDRPVEKRFAGLICARNDGASLAPAALDPHKTADCSSATKFSTGRKDHNERFAAPRKNDSSSPWRRRCARRTLQPWYDAQACPVNGFGLVLAPNSVSWPGRIGRA